MKKTLKIKRAYLPIGTFGIMSHMGKELFHTVERPWLNNEKNISCIPAGIYSLIPYTSDKYQDVYALENRNVGVTVSGPSQRTHCLIHIANFIRQVEGCIGVGMSLYSDSWGIAQSAEAMGRLRELLGDADGWILDIS